MNKQKVSKVLSCFENKNHQEYNAREPNWLAVSWDFSNPRIFGYCNDPGTETARKCAVNKCIEKGGKNCKPLCGRSTGKRLRACPLGVNTYVASSTYGRFGCGTRWVER